jgi:hypothetical protein
VDVEVDVDVEPEPVPLADAPLPAVASATVIPIRAAPATTNMPLPSSNCALRTPAGFPGARGPPEAAAWANAGIININIDKIAAETAFTALLPSHLNVQGAGSKTVPSH